MNSIIKLFLRAKHWQLFTIGFVPVIIFYTYTMFNLFSHDFNNQPPDISQMMDSYKYFGPIMILIAIVNYGWIWATGVGLQAKLPPYVKMKIRRFNWFIGIPFFYLVLISIFLTAFFNFVIPDFISNSFDPNPMFFIGIAVVIIPLHLFSLFAIFYSMYFTAKTIKSVELQREATFSDFVAEFFLIWFFPIGIWILQPKINKLEEGTGVFHQKSL